MDWYHCLSMKIDLISFWRLEQIRWTSRPEAAECFSLINTKLFWLSAFNQLLNKHLVDQWSGPRLAPAWLLIMPLLRPQHKLELERERISGTCRPQAGVLGLASAAERVSEAGARRKDILSNFILSTAGSGTRVIGIPIMRHRCGEPGPCWQT